MRPKINPKIESYIDVCKAEIYQLPIEQAILQAEQIGLLLRANEVGIYALNDVESFLINKFTTDISIDSNFKIADSSASERIIFIATELYHSGGHSRLMERLATFLEPRPDLLITKKPTDTIIEREKDFFSNVYHSCEYYSSVAEKISFLLKVILNYNILVLNIHPEDIYAVVACGLAKKINKNLKIHFVNHADHCFSYGSYIADVWYEISSYGISIDTMRELDARKCFLGIPIDTSKNIKNDSYKFENGDLILTAASAIKYKPNEMQSIMPLVSALLEKYNKSTFQVIGANFITNYWWWRLKFKYKDRLKLSKSLPYEEYLNVTSSAKLYIDSHPFPGGTAFAEQFLQGRLCAGLKSTYSGYTPLEIFKKESINDVLSEIELVNDHAIIEVKKQIEEQHGFISVKARFLDAILNGVYATRRMHLSTPKINYAFEKIPVRIGNMSQIISVSTKKAFCFLCIRRAFLKIYLSFNYLKSILRK